MSSPNNEGSPTTNGEAYGFDTPNKASSNLVNTIKQQKLMSQSLPSGSRTAQLLGLSGKKKEIDLNQLDHNNFTKSLSGKSENHTKKKGNRVPSVLKKSARAPAIRSFPGQVTKKVIEVKGAVYAADLEREAARTYVPPPPTKDELMLEEEFLRIDQSKLPLEIFDSLEFQAFDKQPMEWITPMCEGHSPYLHQGKWIWRKCAVLDYNDDQGMFRIRFSDDHEPKHVSRLNLRFDTEDENNFFARRDFAEIGRKEAKSIMRFDHYVNMQPKERIRPINESVLRKVHGRILSGLPINVPFPEQGTPLGYLLKDLTGELILFYSRTMKKIVVLSALGEIKYDADIVARYTQLALPPVEPKPPVPLIGKVECPDYPFQERELRIGHVHYSSSSELIKLFTWLYSKYDSLFQHFSFVDVSMNKLELPCSLSDFVATQESQFAACSTRVTQEFMRGFLDTLTDNLQDLYDFFQSNETVYMTGTLCRVLRSFDLRLVTLLRTTLIKSLEEWENILSTRSVLDVDTESIGTSASAYARVSEKIFPSDTRIPLFTATIISTHQTIENEDGSTTTSKGNIALSPPVGEFERQFLIFIDNLVNYFNQLVSPEKELMSLLHLNERILLNIGKNDPLLKDLDVHVQSTRDRITTVIRSAFSRPLELVKLYDSHSWLLESDTAEFIENFASSVPPPELKDFENEIARLDTSIKEVGALSFEEEDFGIVRLQCKDIRERLISRALDLRNGLLGVLVTRARESNIETIDGYNEILKRQAQKPANEYELADLRDYIEKSKSTVVEYMKKVKASREMLAVLDTYNVPLGADDMGLSWSTLEYPSRIQASAEQVEVALEVDKVRMMDKLAVEKEKFELMIEQMGEDVKNTKNLTDYSQFEAYTEQINGLMDSINEAKERGEDFNMREEVFSFAPSDYSILDKYTDELTPFFRLWNMTTDFHNSKKDWLHGEFKELDGVKIEEDMTEWWKGSFKLVKSLDDDAPDAAACAQELRNETTEFRQHLPVIQSLASKALKRRHWERLSDLLGHEVDPEENLTLQALLDMNAADNIEGIQEITIAAEKEYNLERGLNNMITEWKTIEFDVKEYKNTGTYVVGGIDDIVTLLDDHIVKTQTMRGSPFIKPIEKECKEWEFKLKYAQSLLDEWIACQRSWMYLEPIFGSEDIMRQLPTEARRFQNVDQLWRKTLGETYADPNYITQADPEKRLEEKFKVANVKLDEITKGLNDYLEIKRLYFPRFFFLSNDELLEILSQTKDPMAVQPHLGKCFEGINKVRFESDKKISAIISAEGETVDMEKDMIVDPETPANKGNVEKWLLVLESNQWFTIREQTELSLAEYVRIPRRDWILNWPAQVILGVSCVYWTQEVSASLDKGGGAALEKCLEVLNGQLRDMVDLVRGNLKKLQRKTMGALTTIDVHNRDVVAKMCRLGVAEQHDFEWMSQLRYYWSEAWKDGQAVKEGQKTMVARIVNARCLYGYEYLGNSMRLVITALTDRCYRTMIGAIDLLYGGAPEGPAGTGKTETVKDLSKAMAIHCVVFNCSDGLDYLAMAKFFKGLAGCGSWCCFDEFNRINVEVLSVIAQQILMINQAKREKKEMFHFEGTYMKLNSNCNVFITMNPGYAGRAELPDNLKALFRPCAMMVPDYAMIGEIRLYSFGFEAARSNAQKIVKVLQLSSEQLSSQKHYDYGMRAVNSILVAAGNLRQQLGNDPEWDESRIVLRSINDVNLAKFLVEDIPLFKGITSDLFPGVVLPDADYMQLPDCIRRCADKGIEVAPGNSLRVEVSDSYMLKTVQLYEMVLVRHGVMVVGQTCSGKTATIHNLAKAMTLACNEGSELFDQKVQIHTINPKSVTSGQLYGLFDENTHEFVDGILAITFRKCSKDTSSDRQWLLLDGPVDAVWIENMNTVLDDNKKLCLTSGEIIKMSDQMTMMFEAEDLEQASPATVSRVGMIFCETRNIGWRAPRNIWLDSLSEELQGHREYLSELFEWLFAPMAYFMIKNCKQPSPIQAQEVIFSMTRLLTCLFDFADGRAGDLNKVIEGCFLFAMTWSLGASVDGDGRINFDRYLRLFLKGEVDETDEFKDFKIKNPDYMGDHTRTALMSPPDSSLIYDLIFDVKTAKWVSWLDGQPVFKIERDAQFNSIVVPTIDTIRHEWLLDALLNKGFNVMCTGDTGTGKSVSVASKLKILPHDTYQSMSLTFSAQTSANQTQDLIDSKLDKRRKGVYGPPLGVKCVVFVDDLNMPAKEVYGAQPPIEILRQWMDHQGWYDRKEHEFKRLVDIMFCAAMGPPGGGRTKITQRYIRHFNVINFINFSDESLGRVFGTILDWRLAQGFAGPVKQMSSSIVEATIGIYNTIAAELLPTPVKSHYTFNLRDLSKVFQGVLQGSPDLIKDKEGIVRLWSHECMRVFYDRLIDDTDRTWFTEHSAETIKEYFGMDFAKIKGANDVIMYSNFGDPKSVSKPYAELGDRTVLQKTMNDYLDDFNQMTSKPMNLVLFNSAIEHVARISRVINQPYGNCLLVGVGGSGRKSLTTLAVSIADFELFTIEITKSYSMFDWREDIKSMMNKAAINNKQTVFLMDDTQIVNESFLEDINGILNTGEVANLFNSEDMGIMMEALSKDCQAAGINPGSPQEVYNFYVSRVRMNLHVALCLSPIGDAFRRRLRMFPSLVNCCTIDWFSEWPEEALRSVANYFMINLDLDENIKVGVVDVCVDMQMRTTSLSKRFLAEMGRNYYITPTSYLSLINMFKDLLNVQRTDVFDQKARYDNGLAKLRETADQVNEMQVYLEDLQPKLKEATIATDALIVKVSADRKVADEQAVVVNAEAEVCGKQADAANAIKAECEADLAEAIPALQAAEKALKSLDKSDITEMKAMKKPSHAIKMVMAACCHMFGIKKDKKVKEGDMDIDPFWPPAVKELLGDPKFLTRLQTYDRDNMSTTVVEAAKKFTEDPDFAPDVVAKKGSAAAAGIARWVHAMVKYDRVAKVVAPKKAALKQAQGELKEAQAALDIKQAALKEVMDKVAALETQLHEAEDKKESLKNQVIDCEAKLKRADALIKGLGGEKTRWTQMSEKLAETYDNVTGDIVLAAGVIAYMGAFTVQYRDDAIQQWSNALREKGITCSGDFSLRETLGSPVEIRSWIINRLPNDSFSVENAIMLFRSNRWPLMIDPQGQANKWVKKMEEAQGIKVVKQNQSNFVRTVENAIQFGVPVLLENVPEQLDPILEPILLKQIVTAGGVSTIRLGDSTVEYDPNFKLYITTKLRNPHYPPELCVKVNLLNFMATQDGLQDQMLGRVVAMEQKELEAQRQQLVIEDAENQRQLKEIEDKILHLLKNAEGNILDDEVLINTLGDSKKTSNIIEEKVKVATKTQEKIAKVRQGYVPVAFQAASLFFCIADLAGVDPMYQYSLDWYIGLYESSIDTAEKSTNLEERLKNLNDTFTYMLYVNVCRSLFEKDKLLFSFLLTTKIMLGQNSLSPGELRFFLQGSTSMDLAEPNPYTWLPDKSWNDILAMVDIDSLKVFKDIFLKAGAAWENVYNCLQPAEEVEKIVGDQFNPFQKLCILRCLRPDVVVPAVQSFIANEMGSRFIEPPPFDLKTCYADAKSYTPLIFVLTPGADPMTELFKLAAEYDFSNKLQVISLGQGQGPIAEAAITNAVEKGMWVCLQNCHLCVSWMPTLEKTCEEFSEDSVHPNFRLWLTSEPSAAFPAFVLQNGVKMTNEPPKGMRANLLGSLYQVDKEWFETCQRKVEFKKMLFGLCFFHAAVRERRKFGPLGWNIQYVFSPPDLRISMDQLRIFLDDLRPTDKIPYEALAYLVGECNYGGRVTDDKDRRCILNILDDFYTPAIVEDEYKFSPSGTYYAPPNGTVDNFVDYVRTLPYSEGPEVFGLHDNANISCAIAETNGLLDTALSLQPRSSGGGGKSWAETLAELAHDIEARIPPIFDIEKALILFPVMYSESMNTVLTQECIRFNKLIGRVKSSLKEVQRAIKGLVVMSAELEGMGNSMVVGKVPSMWSAVAYPSLKPLGSWVSDLLQRIDFLQTWMDNGSPLVYWISGFFFTQAFITGTLQNFARKYQRPIDTVDYDFSVLTPDEMKSADEAKPEDGAVVHGLFLEGARWDVTDHVLAESNPRELYITMPYIHLLPKPKTDIEEVEGVPEQYTGQRDGTAHVYMCPVYKTSFRQGTLSTTGHSTNFVMMIRIPQAAEHKQKHWIKRGVAMLTQLDD